MSKSETLTFKKPFNFLLAAFEYAANSLGNGLSDLSTSTKKRKIPTNKIFLAALVLLVVLGLFYWVKTFVSGINRPTPTEEKTTIAPARSTHQVNKSFDFPLRDEKGEEVSKIKFIVENAELRDEIVVKGQRASSVSGRVFLVINLKITNSFKKTVQINTRDYLRLTVNNNDKEFLAPEIHNDPVEAQAISTKYTRVAFAINESDKNLKLRIGDPDKEEKTVVDLKL
ncbi:hypothetical protein HYS97_02730 [Candidatus Daviesbacteria bacterium]|nr:hypothetical protein [Candidatus Daviesbacteria bacterium]